MGGSCKTPKCAIFAFIFFLLKTNYVSAQNNRGNDTTYYYVYFPGSITGRLFKITAEEYINKINYFSIGPGIGYAYTLSLFHHIFFTGSLTGDLNFSFVN